MIKRTQVLVICGGSRRMPTDEEWEYINKKVESGEMIVRVDNSDDLIGEKLHEKLMNEMIKIDTLEYMEDTEDNFSQPWKKSFKHSHPALRRKR